MVAHVGGCESSLHEQQQGFPAAFSLLDKVMQRAVTKQHKLRSVKTMETVLMMMPSDGSGLALVTKYCWPERLTKPPATSYESVVSG